MECGQTMPVCIVRKKLIDRLYALASLYTEAINRLGVIAARRDLVALARELTEARRAREACTALRDTLAHHRLVHGC